MKEPPPIDAVETNRDADQCSSTWRQVVAAAKWKLSRLGQAEGHEPRTHTKQHEPEVTNFVCPASCHFVSFRGSIFLVCPTLVGFDLVKKADRLNPPPKRKVSDEAPQKSSLQQPTPRRLVNRLQRRRDDVLRFMSDESVPFDNNGSERDLRMVKLQGRGARPPSKAGCSQSSQAKL